MTARPAVHSGVTSPSRWLWPPAAIGVAFLLVPLVALAQETPWTRLPELLTSTSSRTALLLSLRTATIATLLCLLLGVPLAFVLARGRPAIVRVVRPLVTVPLVLPPVVAGLTLLLAFGRHGIVGAPLRSLFGVRVPFSTTAVVLAEAFVSMPYLVLALDGALQSVGPRYDAVAATLGAHRLTTFRRVTLPLAAPALVSGTVLCWARALGEFGATITFAGSLPGVTQTLPLRIYDVLLVDQDAAIALGLVLVLVAALVLAFASSRRLPGLRWGVSSRE